MKNNAFTVPLCKRRQSKPPWYSKTDLSAATPAVKAVEAVDACAGKVIGAVLAKGGAVLLTADHATPTKCTIRTPSTPFTAHTTNPVPFLVAGVENAKLREGGVLADIAPTMLKIMGLPQPEEMTGKSILE